MRLWHEEQFGPVVPVAVYQEMGEVYDYIAKMPYGQQAAIFTQVMSDMGLVATSTSISINISISKINSACNDSY